MENQNIQKIAKALRIIGIIALILSGCVFLYQSYSLWGSIERFIMYAGLLSAVGGLGLFSIKKLKEPKGARAFLTLSTAGVSGLFAQFGALIYSFQGGESKNVLFSSFHLATNNLTHLILAGVTTTIVSLFFGFLGFQFLNRNDIKIQLSSFLGFNLLLLIPTRTYFIPLLMILIFIIVIYQLYRKKSIFYFNSDTQDKYISMLILITPLVIAVLRAHFYINFSHNLIMSAFLLSLLSFGCGQFQTFLNQKNTNDLTINDDTHNKIEFKSSKSLWFLSSLLFLLFSELVFIGEIFKQSYLTHLNAQIQLVIYLITLHITVRVSKKYLNFKPSNYLINALWVISGFYFCLGAMIQPLNFSFFALFSISVIGIIEGLQLKNKVIFKTGLLLSLLTVIQTIIWAQIETHIFNWLSLAILGGLGILISSQLENSYHKIKIYIKKYKKHFEKV